MRQHSTAKSARAKSHRHPNQTLRVLGQRLRDIRALQEDSRRCRPHRPTEFQIHAAGGRWHARPSYDLQPTTGSAKTAATVGDIFFKKYLGSNFQNQ